MHLKILKNSTFLPQLLIPLLLTSCFSKEVYIIKVGYGDEPVKKVEKAKGEGVNSSVEPELSFDSIPIYFGPEYTVGILSFKDKTKSDKVGLGEELARELNESISSTGMEPLYIAEGNDGGEEVDFRLMGEIRVFEEIVDDKGFLHTKLEVNIVIEEVLTGDLLIKDEINGYFKERIGSRISEKVKIESFQNARKKAFKSLAIKAFAPFVEKLNKFPFKSRILAISDGKVYFKAGRRSRLKVGERLKVYKNQKARLLVGEILLESHEGEKISVASIALGGGLSEGDLIEKEIVSPPL